MDHIHQQLDIGNIISIVSTDLSKAFDTLSHSLLLNKLRDKGFAGSATAWLGSYLSNRMQQVKMNNIISSKQVVESGVPQGSILGPILFIAFTADLNEHIPEHRISAYADDTQIRLQAKVRRK